MASLSILLRRLRTLLWTAVSIVVITVAVLVGIGKLLMPYSSNYQPRLEAWLSEEFGRPVKLAGFEGEWKAFGPRISLRGMTLHPVEGGSSQVAIQEAALDIKPLNALLPNRPVYQFRVIGAHFELFHRLDGRWELSGLGVSAPESGTSGSALRQLSQVGEVFLQDSFLRYRDEKFGVDLNFSSIEGRLQTNDETIATEVKATIASEQTGYVFGEIDGVFKLLLDDEQQMRDASWQISAREIMLAALQGRIPDNPLVPVTGWLNTELWGTWTREQGHIIQGVSDLRDSRLVNQYQNLSIKRVNTRMKWSHVSSGKWRLDFSDFRLDDGKQPWVAPRISVARNMEEGMGLWIGADELPLEFPLNMARDVMSMYQTQWPAFLPRNASGQVTGLDLILNSDWRLRLARGTVKGASVSDWKNWPELKGLNGTVDLGEGFGVVSLNSDSLDMNWKGMFRDPLQFTMPGCELDFRWGGEWQIGFRECSLHNDDIAASGFVVISRNGGRPAVDVNVAVPRGNAGNLDSYWPEKVIKPKVQKWLRSSLLSGEIHNGRFQIHGDLDHWPFRHGEGRFEAYTEIRSGSLDYVPDWPVARNLTAVARFVGASMFVDGRIENIGGIATQNVSASIWDLKKPVIIVDYEADTQLPALLAFLQNSPINEEIDADLSRFEFTGPANTTGRLTVPLGAVAGSIEVNGQVELSNSTFEDPEAEIFISDIGGTLEYNQSGFRGVELPALFRDKPAVLSIQGGNEARHQFLAEMTGRFDVQDVIPEFISQSYEPLAAITGVTDWRMLMTVTNPDSIESEALAGQQNLTGPDGSGLAVLEITSDLTEIALELPAPLSKQPDEKLPLRLTYPLAGDSRILDLKLSDRAVLQFDLGDGTSDPRRTLIHMGEDPPPLPPPGFLTITGAGGQLDLDGWIDLIVDGAEQGKGLGGLELEKGQIHAEQLIFLDRLFADVEMGFESEGSVLKANFMGAGIEGKVSFTSNTQGASTLNAEFERLALAKPLTEGVNMETDPSELPAVHLYAKSFQYSGFELGETRIEAYPTNEGYHFEKVDSHSDLVEVSARGDWSLEEDGQRSDFTIHMNSESLGSILQSMDISSSMEGGQTQLKFNAWWPGPPSSFALSRLNGEIEFNVSQGNITNASAGSGRVLGLLSVQALPKRLALDFRDVFDSGFGFDEAAGSFQMENGMARTEDVLLKSSAANILVSGSTDLVAQQYDQVMTVKPGLGNALPIIGAIAGGPGGAAAGLALQGLLQKQLGEVMQVQYTIKGPWEEPSIDPIIKESVDGG